MSPLSCRLITHSECLQELDLDDNLIGDLGGRGILEALMDRKEGQENMCCQPCSQDLSPLSPLVPMTKGGRRETAWGRCCCFASLQGATGFSSKLSWTHLDCPELTWTTLNSPELSSTALNWHEMTWTEIRSLLFIQTCLSSEQLLRMHLLPFTINVRIIHA